MQPPIQPDDRRAALIDAAVQVFVRYGFKKTSMDEVARAAGLSRQGLYLHFPTKEILFREGVTFLLERSLAQGRAALHEEGLSLEERMVTAFDTMYGQYVEGMGSSTHLEELFEATKQLVGGLVQEQEQSFREAVMRVLTQAGITARWKSAKISARELADTLDSVAYGLKHRVTTRTDFRERFRRAVRIICCPP